MISYTFLTEPSEWQLAGILALYRAEGWWWDDDQHDHVVRRIIHGSHCFVIAETDGRVIGMGRAISDRASDAYIQDVTVARQFRRRRIGSAIVGMLVRRLRQDGLEWIGIIAEPGSSPFYQQLGFAVMRNSQPMLWTADGTQTPDPR